MKQGNGYVIIYTIVLTVVCAVALAVTALGLKPFQDANKELEKKQNILATVMEVKTREEAKDLYDKRVKSYVIDFQGKIIEGAVAEKIDIEGEYKKKPEERQLPVFEIKSDKNPEQTDFYVFPIQGFGLWDKIWGFVSLKGDLNTINGVKFDHKAETPGLGARIATNEVQKRYSGKQIFEGNQLAFVEMMKGEGNDYSSDKHKVDGMSGATITGKGVNKMLKDYLVCYEKFIKSKTQKTAIL